MLPEHRELLREVTVELGKVLEARGIEDLAVAPLLEGVRATATQPDVEVVSSGHEGVTDGTEVRYGLFMRRANAGGQLDHAFGDLRRDAARDLFVLDEPHEIGGGLGQVVVVRVDDLDLEFNAEGERLRVDERFE